MKVHLVKSYNILDIKFTVFCGQITNISNDLLYTNSRNASTCLTCITKYDESKGTKIVEEH